LLCSLSTALFDCSEEKVSARGLVTSGTMIPDRRDDALANLIVVEHIQNVHAEILLVRSKK